MGDDIITFGEVNNGLREPLAIAFEMGLETTDNPELIRMFESTKALFHVHTQFVGHNMDSDTKVGELDNNTISPSQIRAYFNTVGVSPDTLNDLADLLESDAALEHQPDGRDLNQYSASIRDFYSKLTSEV